MLESFDLLGYGDRDISGDVGQFMILSTMGQEICNHSRDRKMVLARGTKWHNFLLVVGGQILTVSSIPASNILILNYIVTRFISAKLGFLLDTCGGEIVLNIDAYGASSF